MHAANNISYRRGPGLSDNAFLSLSFVLRRLSRPVLCVVAHLDPMEISITSIDIRQNRQLTVRSH